MIKYEWRTSVSADESAELAGLLGRAAEYDAEPEYNRIDFADVDRAMSQSDSSVRHLLVWMLPYATALGEPDQPDRIAALLRVRCSPDGSAQASAVVDPELRSIGIMTLLLERVGLNTASPGGWLGTGAHTVTAWAQGNHPAAGRLSNRFLIPRTRRVWKLIRSADAAEDATAAPVLELIDDAALADEAGMTGVIIYVDSDDTDLVNACRLAGFQHDRTDVRYQLGGQL